MGLVEATESGSNKIVLQRDKTYVRVAPMAVKLVPSEFPFRVRWMSALMPGSPKRFIGSGATGK
jgi:hypothetical protein